MHEKILSQIAGWRRQLLDLSRRNRLISCPVGSTGVVEIADPDVEAVWRQLAVGNGTMRFVWKRDLFDEPAVEEPPAVEETSAAAGADVPKLTSAGGLIPTTEPVVTPSDSTSEPGAAVKEKVRSLEECLASPRLEKSHLLTRLTDRGLAARLNKLAYAAETSLSEQGVNVLFLAFGFLKWQEPDDPKKDYFAPLMLVPVELERVGVDAGWKLAEYEDEVVENLCLREKLHAEFGFELPGFPEDGLEAPGGRTAYYDRVRGLLRANPATSRWDVVDGVLLGAFAFQKIAMWKDLGDNAERIAVHPICRAIAGDLSAEPVAAVDLPPLEEFDARVHPRELHSILDCDGSQLEAVYAVKKGLSLVLDGPPGTGKSQTIANLIAEFLADGKTVLFVSEKMAALEVVKRRLDLAGLGDFVLECHSHAANKKEIIQELGRCLELPAVRPKDRTEPLDRLFEERQKLNAYVRALHSPRSALRATPFDVYGKVASLAGVPIVDWSDPAVFEKGPRWLEDAAGSLEELRRHAAVIESFDAHPWRGCRLDGHSHGAEDDLRRLLGDLARAAETVEAGCGPLRARGLLPEVLTPASLPSAVEEVSLLLGYPVFPKAWFEGPLSAAVADVRLTDEAVRRRRDARRRVAEFGEVAVAGPLDEQLREAVEAGGDACGHLKPNPHGTLRRQAAHLEAVVGRVSDAIERTEAVAASLQEFGTAIGFPFGPTLSPLVAERLAELGKAVGGSGHFLPGWFDEQRRQELARLAPGLEAEDAALRAAARGLRLKLADAGIASPVDRWAVALSEIGGGELEAARSTQDRLRSRLCPLAFTAEGEVRAEEAARYRSTFSRMFGAWKAVRVRVAELYATAPPAADAQLLADMESLGEFHRRHQAVWRRWSTLREELKPLYLGEVPESPAEVSADLKAVGDYQSRAAAFEARIEPIRTDLPKAADGGYDWPRLAAGLRSLGQLQALGVVIKDRLRQVLSTEGTFRPANVARAADDLLARLAELHEAADGLKPSIALGRVGPEGSPLQRCGLADLKSWLTHVRDGLDHRLRALRRVCELLEPDADLALADVDSRAAAWRDYRDAARRLTEVWPGTAWRFDGIGDPLAVDWPATVALADELERFIGKYGDSPPPAVAAAVTDATSRSGAAEDLATLRRVISDRWQSAWAQWGEVYEVAFSSGGGRSLDSRPLPEVAEWSRRQAEAVPSFAGWMRFRDLCRRIEELGAGSVLRAVLESRLEPSEARDAFLARLYRLWIDEAVRTDPDLRSFRSEAREEAIGRFRELDRRSVAEAGRRVSERLLSAPGRPRRNELAPKDSEIRTLMHQASLKRRHWPLRRLFAQIPTVLPRLKPCVMMSPLAVSTYLDSPRIKFDLVIFDEASQIRPFDAVGAIYRGTQLVVAGDPRQLPPTSFFEKLLAGDESAGDDEDGDELLGRLEDFESILEVCTSVGLPRRRLCWHYRSRREPLIAFSNRHFYDSDLVTFPSVFDVDKASPVRMAFCEEGRWKTGRNGGFNPAEVRLVADLVVGHFRQTPRKSLGVITFNQRQQFRLMEELDRAARENPDLAGALFGEGAEPLFVKNLENVQGDERDRIIISVAYGFDEAGKFAMRFGPLNQQGGERRLNVAVTRAREEVVVASSIRSEHINLANTQARGVHLLKAYLEFAERGPSASVRAGEQEAGERDGFVLEVQKALAERGCHTHRRVGHGGSRIDLALLHPDEPDRYVMGVECDGETYRRAATARDRDRLRAEVLGGLGWGVARVWSADWLSNRERQLSKIEDEFRRRTLPNAEPVSDEPGEIEEPEEDVVDVEFEVVSSALRLGYSEPAVAAAPPRRFASIDEVPDGHLTEVIVDLVRSSGRTPEDGLVRSVAQSLGFRRLGRKIEERIKWSIRSLVRKRQLARDEDRYLMVP